MEKLRERIDAERKTAQLAEEFNTGTMSDKKPETDKGVVDEAKDYLAPKTPTTAASK
jgi:hypothetical protein